MIKTVLLLFVVAVASHPAYIGCDLKVVSTYAAAGRDIMTTPTIMGVTPEVADLTFATEVEAGATLDLTFPATAGQGIVHVSSGKIAVLDNFDSPCENMIRSSGGMLESKTVQLTAPSTVGDVTLSIVYSKGFGQPVFRFSQSIAVKAASSGGSGSDSSTGGTDGPADSTGPADSDSTDPADSDSTGPADSDSTGQESAAMAPKLGLATLAASLSFLL